MFFSSLETRVTPNRYVVYRPPNISMFSEPMGVKKATILKHVYRKYLKIVCLVCNSNVSGSLL
jgi:hypothetical protein